MASPTWWTWVWVNSGSWWWTGRPGMLQFMESQRVGHDWLNWTLYWKGSKPGQGAWWERKLSQYEMRISAVSNFVFWSPPHSEFEGYTAVQYGLHIFWRATWKNISCRVHEERKEQKFVYSLSQTATLHWPRFTPQGMDSTALNCGIWALVATYDWLPSSSDDKESSCNAGNPGSIPMSEDPWRRKWLATPEFLPGEFHGQKSLLGYKPWGC